MSLVFWDSMLFVYLFEEQPEFSGRVSEIRQRMLARKDRLCTSAFTVGEVLSAPYARGDLRLANVYRTALSRPQVETISFTGETAEHFARIRVDRSIAAPDAIQLACAAQAGVDLFLTNDRRLARKSIPGIQFIADLSFDYL
jgi:predicted nucleic acid-binding protein